MESQPGGRLILVRGTAIRVIVAVALSVSTGACAEPPKRVNPVGLSFAAYEDAARRSWTRSQSRPLATAVWYPAAPGSRESEWRVGIFNAGWNAQKAPLSAATTKRPLIVLSHGTGGGAAGMAWLAETLASNGYIVAAVNHHGNTAAEPSYSFKGLCCGGNGRGICRSSSTSCWPTRSLVLT